MANASYKSAVARIASIRYTDLSKLKRVKIPEEEQKLVEAFIKSSKNNEKNNEDYEPPMKALHRESPKLTITDQDTLMKMFEAGTPIKCTRIPKREQRSVEYFMTKEKEKEQKKKNKKK